MQPGIVAVSRFAWRDRKRSVCRPSGTFRGDAAFAAAQRLGADAVIVGYGDAVPTGGTWRWSLQAAGINESWNGTLEEGVHGAADIFARSAQAFAALPEVSLLVEVEGVPTLKEYARVAEILAAAPRRAQRAARRSRRHAARSSRC